jgi:hypothetical protein
LRGDPLFSFPFTGNLLAIAAKWNYEAI